VSAPASTPAAVFLEEQGWTRDRIAIVLEVQTPQVGKYLGGPRRVSPGQKTRLVNEFGDAAYELVQMCDAAWRVNREAPKAPRPNRQPKEKYVPPVYNGPRYTIDEWIERFGRPGGGGPDINGRYRGYFDTEPCFLGE
jgi:plasmid maintenance system antidote protein VapI